MLFFENKAKATGIEQCEPTIHMVSYIIQDGGQKSYRRSYSVGPMEIKLVKGFKMVLLMHSFHLIVLTYFQAEKLKYEKIAH